MKIKVSDYIAQVILEHEINTVFTVVGGGAMHLNDTFGHHPQIRCIYNHHEQASAIAAEAYARVNGNMAVCCVTSGPGAINALNGVAGAYLDSIPMLVISGQTKSTLTVKKSGLPLRSLGNQEFDIISAVKGMTKYCEMVMEPLEIRRCLEEAIFQAKNGRPGPVWLDIPLDVQGAYIETGELQAFERPCKNTETLNIQCKSVIEQLRKSKRPVLYVGNGVRIANAYQVFETFFRALNIPVVTCWNSIDLIETDDMNYVGRAGIMGDRAGNFAVQNSDFLLCVGTRLNIYQVGYDVSTWARNAFVVMVDIDEAELQKPTIRVDFPICADVKYFMETMLQELKSYPLPIWDEWLRKGDEWKRKYPVVQEKHYASGLVNMYAFMNEFSKSLPVDMITVVANGSASVVGSQSYVIKKGQRFIMNCGLSSMGYDLPAAIGVSVAKPGTDIVCIAGDGSIQMNIQELQTIVTNRFPIKIFVLNNQGYHQIRQTQTNIFGNDLVGVGPQSGDLGFPDFEKIAFAYGFDYYKCDDNKHFMEKVEEAFHKNGPVICEVVCSIEQFYEPKSASRKLEDGSMYSPPLEDMYPFLDRDELKENMLE